MQTKKRKKKKTRFSDETINFKKALVSRSETKEFEKIKQKQFSGRISGRKKILIQTHRHTQPTRTTTTCRKTSE